MAASVPTIREALHRMIDVTSDDMTLDTLAKIVLTRATFQVLTPERAAHIAVLADLVGSNDIEIGGTAFFRAPGQMNCFMLGTVIDARETADGITQLRVNVDDMPFVQWLPLSELTRIR